MAQNKLSDLNNHLFAQLERLGDEDLTPDQLKVEVERSKSINIIARNIIDNAKTSLEGVRIAYEYSPRDTMPEQFLPKQLNT
jgi:predicted transcriptional regulator